MRAVLILGVVLALAGCDAGSDEAPTAEPATTVAVPSTEELTISATYRITSVPPAASGPYRAVGTFTTTGAVDDSGSAALVFRITARGADTLRGEETFSGAKGDFVVRFEGSAVAEGDRQLYERPGPTRVHGEGASRIDRGSGAYDRLRGRAGTTRYAIDFGRRTTTSRLTFGQS